MENTYKSAKISTKTAKQLQNFYDFLKVDRAFQKSMEELYEHLYLEYVEETEEIIGNAITKKIIKPGDGALLPYSYWIYLSNEYDKGKDEDGRLLNPYKKHYELYLQRATAIAWFYTQSIVLPLPSFDLAKKYKTSDGSFTMALIRNFQGLPLYVPLKSRRYVGALISTQVCLASEAPKIWQYYGHELNPTDLTYVYSIFFDLFGASKDNSVSFACPLYVTFSSKEEFEAKKWDIKKDLSWVKETVSAHTPDITDVRACMAAMEACLYISQHLPSPNWFCDRKTISLVTDQVDGTVFALPPDHASIYALAKEGCFSLPSSDLKVKVKSDYDF